MLDSFLSFVSHLALLDVSLDLDEHGSYFECHCVWGESTTPKAIKINNYILKYIPNIHF